MSAATGEELESLNSQIAALEQQLAQAHEQKERAVSRAQLTKSGHVYVISNIGSFGNEVFKIGMTRRLEPLDRVKEFFRVPLAEAQEYRETLALIKSLQAAVAAIHVQRQHGVEPPVESLSVPSPQFA